MKHKQIYACKILAKAERTITRPPAKTKLNKQNSRPLQWLLQIESIYHEKQIGWK